MSNEGIAITIERQPAVLNGIARDDGVLLRRDSSGRWHCTTWGRQGEVDITDLLHLAIGVEAVSGPWADEDEEQ